MSKPSGREEPASSVVKKAYEPPRILTIEPLEAVAVVCTPNGKADPPGVSTCTFLNS